jgi:hypothetical protein
LVQGFTPTARSRCCEHRLKGEQQGLFNICSGVMLALRNKAHHSLINTLAQTDALKFCTFINSELILVAARGTLKLGV